MRGRGGGDGGVGVEAGRHACRIAPDGGGCGLIREHQTVRVMAWGDDGEGISSELRTLLGVEFTEEAIHIGAEV